MIGAFKPKIFRYKSKDYANDPVDRMARCLRNGVPLSCHGFMLAFSSFLPRASSQQDYQILSSTRSPYCDLQYDAQSVRARGEGARLLIVAMMLLP